MTGKKTSSISLSRSKARGKPKTTTPKRQRKLIIYTSGDVTSQAICQLMIDKGVSFDRRDIRKSIPGEGQRDLIFLQRLNLDTVPQLFHEDGSHIGGFDEARLYLVQLPDPKPHLASA